MEFILLISFVESKFGGPAEDALASLAELILEFPSLIVQSTQGMFDTRIQFVNRRVFPVINHTAVWQFSFKYT